MLSDGIKLLGTSVAENFTIENGTVLPSSGNNTGELFYLTTGQAGLYVYNGSTWVAAGSGGSGGTANALSATGASPRNGTTPGVYAGVDSNTDPVLTLTNSNAAAGSKVSQIYVPDDGIIRWALSNDALSSTTSFMSITRSGNTASNITFASTIFNLTGLTGGLQVNSSAGTAGQVLTSQGSSAAPTWSTVTATLPSVVTTSSIFNAPMTVNTTVAGVQIGRNSGGSSNDSQILLTNPAAATNQKLTRINTVFGSGTNGDFIIDFVDDAYTSSNAFMRVTRSGNTVGTLTLTGATINLAGLATGGLQLNGSAGTAGQVLTSNGASAAPTWTTPTGGSASLTATQIGFGSAGGSLSGSANFTFTSASNLINLGVAAGSGTLAGADVGSGNSAAGTLTIRGGNGTGSNNNAGTLTLSGGDYTSTNVGPGGNITLKGGNVTGTGTGAGGNVLISGGVATGAAGGYVSISTSSAANAAVTERVRFQANGSWLVNSSAGTSGQVLTSQGAGGSPIWSTVTATATNLAATAGMPGATSTGVYIGTTTSSTTVPIIKMYHSNSTTDEKNWYWIAENGQLVLGGWNDAISATANYIVIDRAANALNYINFNGLAAGFQINGSAGTAGQVLTSGGPSAAPTWSSPAAAVLNGTGTPTVSSATTGIFAGSQGTNYPGIRFVASGLGTDNKVSGIYTDPSTGSFNVSFVNDAVLGQTPFITVTRSGQTSVLMTLVSQSINLSGLSAGLKINNATGTAGQVLTSQGSAAAPTWTTISATVTQIPRTTTFDATAKGQRVAITAGVTIPASTYVAGDVFSFYNDSATDVLITQGSGLTLRLDGTTTTGNRTLRARGTCFVWFNSATEAIITGSVL